MLPKCWLEAVVSGTVVVRPDRGWEIGTDGVAATGAVAEQNVYMPRGRCAAARDAEARTGYLMILNGSRWQAGSADPLAGATQRGHCAGTCVDSRAAFREVSGS
jgi:hypothetical protein